MEFKKLIQETFISKDHKNENFYSYLEFPEIFDLPIERLLKNLQKLERGNYFLLPFEFKLYNIKQLKKRKYKIYSRYFVKIYLTPENKIWRIKKKILCNTIISKKEIDLQGYKEV